MIPLWTVPVLAIAACAVLGALLLVVLPLVASAIWQVRQRRLVRQADRYLKERT